MTAFNFLMVRGVAIIIRDKLTKVFYFKNGINKIKHI